MYVYTVEEETSNLHEYVSYVSTVYSEYTTESTTRSATISNQYTIPTGAVEGEILKKFS